VCGLAGSQELFLRLQILSVSKVFDLIPIAPRFMEGPFVPGVTIAVCLFIGLESVRAINLQNKSSTAKDNS